jgi:hypothetical protein
MNENNTQIVPVGSSAVEGFNSNAIVAGDTISTVLAARAKAEVESRYIMAMRNPRSWDAVRDKLLKACKRPGFAGSATENIWGAAWYKKPIGEGAEGFSVRFAEECMRSMGNIEPRSAVIWDDDSKRIIQIDVVDLENNVCISTNIVINKTKEKKFLKKGEKAISVRVNSNGEPTYLMPATEDDILQKQNAATSKALRNGIMRLVPGDIQAECRDLLLDIRAGDIIDDPSSARKAMLDAFSAIGVTPKMIEEYLQGSVSACSPIEISQLRELFKLIKTGQKTWRQIMSEVNEERGEQSEPEKTEPVKQKMEALTGALKVKGNVINAAPETPPEKEE